MSLRSRVAVAAAAAAIVVTVVSTFLTIHLTERSEEHALDRVLSTQAQALADPLARIARLGRTGQPGSGALQSFVPDGVDGDRTVRLVQPDGEVVVSVGPALPSAVSARGTLEAGSSTLRAGRTAYRAYAETATVGTGDQVQVIAPLAPLHAQARGIRRRGYTIGAVGILAIVTLAWVFTGIALQSLQSLRAMAERVSTTDDLSLRLPPVEPPEIGAVVAAFNAMLQRLQGSAQTREQALQTARSFAADAAHELRTPLTSMAANLESLAEQPSRPADDGLVQALVDDHARIVGTLEALHALTVAELAPTADEPVDLADLLAVMAHEAPRRHPRASVSVDVPDDPVVVSGAREPLRMLFDNLVTNAERHGQRDGVTDVRITLRAEGGRWLVTVDDNGPGFPVVDRERLTERFVRGTSAAPGTGLGLAIAAQQARRHGGSLVLGESPQGGARVEVRLPQA